MSIKTAEEILAYFENWELDEESRIYIYVHHRRYEFLLKTVKKFLQNIQPIRILDIGGSFQTEIMRQNLKAIVNTLGFEDLRFQPRSGEKHFHFDLNDSQYIERWPVIEGHHLIVMAEVIEHLYTSPKLVLACATTWLKKGGYLIIQTPNAVSLRKRIIMLRGRNPYEMIRETRINPGHFREYTIEELISVGKEIGLVCVDYSISNYFMDVSIRQGKSKWRMLKRLLYDTLYNILPNTFRDGITLCFQKKQTKLFMILGDHWHEFEQWQETPVRWISNNATLLSIPQKENISTLSLQILSFYKPRTLQVYLNDQLIHEQNIPTRFVEVEIPVKLKEGENILRFYTPDGCKKPVDIPELKNKDSRCLSLAFQNIALTPMKNNYDMDFIEYSIPDLMTVNSFYSFNITIENTGTEKWDKKGENPVRVSYHWLKDGNVVLWDGIRNKLPCDVTSGNTIEMNINIDAPHEEGNYTLIIDLVKEGITWFETQGAVPLKKNVTVTRAGLKQISGLKY